MKTIELFSEIDSKVATAILSELKAAARQPVTLRINSPGGSVTKGMLVADAIMRHSDVTAEIVGLAASMASVVAIVARRVRISSTALMMVHAPWQETAGDAASLRKTADALEKFGESLARYYMDKSGKSRSVVKGWMDRETWFSADEALAAGLVDEVFKGADAKAALRWKAQFPSLTSRLEAAARTPISVFAQYQLMPAGPRRQEFFAKHKAALWAARRELL
jgi:ATP-dependent Clp endopeptidase proteolytic subunit ClpP